MSIETSIGLGTGQPYPYRRTELVEPDWTRFPGWKDVTPSDWGSAQWQRALADFWQAVRTDDTVAAIPACASTSLSLCQNGSKMCCPTSNICFRCRFPTRTRPAGLNFWPLTSCASRFSSTCSGWKWPFSIAIPWVGW